MPPAIRPDADRCGILLVLSSPSGAGKTSLSRKLLSEDPAFRLSVSVTTRERRPGEVDGEDYFFVSKQRFDEMVSKDDLLEHAKVFGNYYGTPRTPVAESLEAGRDVLFDVDWQGAQQLHHSSALGDLRSLVVTVFILPPSLHDLEARLRNRGQDNDDVVAGRMARARDEISHWAEYDYVLINDDFQKCYSQISTIVSAERWRANRQKWLLPHVESLNSEFEARELESRE